MDKTYYTVYKIRNKINGRVYIGTHKTKNLEDGYMGSGKYLKRAIEKHGVESFEKTILHIFDNPEQMYVKEAEIVNEEFLTTENTYSLRIGGFGGFDFVNTSGKNVYGRNGENGRKALLKLAEEAKIHRINYEKDPLQCLVCKKNISYEQKKQKLRSKNIFCSRKCSVTHNNRGRTRNPLGRNGFNVVATKLESRDRL